MQEANFFGRVRNAYLPSIRVLPESYRDLIVATLSLDGESTTVELGCGGGSLTDFLAHHCSHVTAIDASQEMIEMARSHVTSSHVEWVTTLVENFDFGTDAYDAIISFESFHLFADRPTLLDRIGRGLRPGGTLAIGWYQPEWEELCQSTIINVFANFEATISDWGYWKYPLFGQDLAECAAPWTRPDVQIIDVPSTSTVPSVVEFLCSIERASRIPAPKREDFKASLRESLDALAVNGNFHGTTSYFLSSASVS